MPHTPVTEPQTTAATEALDRMSARMPGRLLAMFGLLAAIGLVGGLIGLGSAPQRVWQAYLVNFLFFSGLAAAGVILGPVLVIARGHWGKPMHRIAQGFGAFLPISYVLFLLLYIGRDHLFPWIESPVNFAGHAVRAEWLNVGAMFGRGALFLLLLYLGCLAFMYYSLRPDMSDVADRLDGWRGGLARRLTRGWRGEEREAERSRRILGRLSPALVLAYVFVLSGMAIDLIMSLEPGWISMLFPAYFFIGAWLSALAATAIAAALLRNPLRLEFATHHWHDLGKLIFAFCVFWAYLWFSQYLPIWYGNMPRETIFVEPRTAAPWTPFSVAFMLMVFALPFVLLIGRKPKMVPAYLASVAGLVLLGLWLERFVMVVPSIWTAGVPLGWIELLVTLGFLGLFAICYAVYAATVPLIPIREVLAIGRPRTGPY